MCHSWSLIDWATSNTDSWSSPQPHSASPSLLEHLPNFRCGPHLGLQAHFLFGTFLFVWAFMEAMLEGWNNCSLYLCNVGNRSQSCCFHQLGLHLLPLPMFVSSPCAHLAFVAFADVLVRNGSLAPPASVRLTKQFEGQGHICTTVTNVAIELLS